MAFRLKVKGMNSTGNRILPAGLLSSLLKITSVLLVKISSSYTKSLLLWLFITLQNFLVVIGYLTAVGVIVNSLVLSLPAYQGYIQFWIPSVRLVDDQGESIIYSIKS